MTSSRICQSIVQLLRSRAPLVQINAANVIVRLVRKQKGPMRSSLIKTLQDAHILRDDVIGKMLSSDNPLVQKAAGILFPVVTGTDFYLFVL